MYRIRTIYKYSQLDQSLKTFLQKYKTTPKLKEEQTPNIITKTRQSIAKTIYPSHQKDDLKEKYLLSKVKEIPLQDRSIFSHFNRPQQLSLNREKEQLSKKLNESAKALEEQLVGEEFIDKYEYPADFVYRIERQRMEGMKKVEKAMNTHDPESSDMELYESIQEWKEINKFEKPIYQRIKNEQIKCYPGTEKGPLPIQDPEGFTDWFVNNHSPQLVEEVDNYVQEVAPDILDTNDLSDDDVANQDRQEEDENNLGGSDNDIDPEVLVSEGPLAFMKESLVSCLLNGEPFDDMEEFSSVQVRSPLEDGELEPAPKNLPHDYVDSLLYMERWTLFRILPVIEDLKHNLFEGEGSPFEYEPHGSLNTYYQLLPKAVRENANVKNVYRGLEWHNPGMTMAEKEQGLNYAARMSQPLSLLTQDIMDKIGQSRKQHPTRFDEESFITDQEQECIDPAVNPEVTEAYIDKRSMIKEGTEGDWPLPDYVKDKKERIDDLPVDYYINDDGFWDDYIQAKEQKHLESSKLGGSKMYLKH